MVKIIEGDILESKEDIVCHQVNCLGIMGGGLALQIKNRYPKTFSSYSRTCKNNTIDNLMGKVTLIEEEDRFIANLFAQRGIGGGLQTDYDSLKNSLETIRDYAQERNLTIALPFNLGCGLAGGNWEIVGEIIVDVFLDYGVTLYKI